MSVQRVTFGHLEETIRLRYVLCLSFNPLLALRIALREWDVFDFGTAKRKGGKSSSRDCSDGNDHDRAGGTNRKVCGRRFLKREARKAGTRAAIMDLKKWEKFRLRRQVLLTLPPCSALHDHWRHR